MTCIRVPKGILCTGDPQRKIVDEEGKQWHFEMHRYCGPMPTNKRGDPLKNDPPASSSFWRVVSWWAQQGEKIDAEGVCMWQKPQEPKLIHLGGNHYQIVNAPSNQEREVE